MSFIINKTTPFISVKLTDLGRESLASGRLNFAYWGVGDSELNYDREYFVDNNQDNPKLSRTSVIIRPLDQQPDIKYFIKPTDGENLQELDPSQIKVIKAVINNRAKERGFFESTRMEGKLFTYDNETAYMVGLGFVDNIYISGTTQLEMGGINFNVGDFVLIKLTNDTLTGFTSFSNIKPIPNLWYKIVDSDGTIAILDRNLPNVSSQTSSASEIFVYPSGEIQESYGQDTATAYWDTGTLSFNANYNITCTDVPVWNMNNVWCEEVAGNPAEMNSPQFEGFKYFGSYTHLGIKYPYLEYFCESEDDSSNDYFKELGAGYLDSVIKSTSIIHYSNNLISNVYGEFLYTKGNNQVEVIVPNIMYHRRNFSTESGTTLGMQFISSGNTKYIGDSNIEYVDLIEDPDYVNGQPKVIGKVLPQSKMVIIHDDEIVAAMSYKSNRNWTLPPLSARLQSPVDGEGVLGVGKTMYLTYTLTTDENSFDGLTQPLPCQYYTKIVNNTSSSKDILFNINDLDLLPYMRKIEKSDYDGLGFYAYYFELIYQIVDNENDRPEADGWLSFNFTTNAITTNPGETIDPKKVERQLAQELGFRLSYDYYTGSTNFNITEALAIPEVNSTGLGLNFGDERGFYGNIKTSIGATIYKTIFDLRVNGSQFNTTTNPTYNVDDEQTIKVSEVGVYDSNRNLVLIGKLNTPISLVDGSVMTAELSIDF